MKRLVRSVGILLSVLLLIGLLFAYAMFEGGFVSWFLFYSFAPIFLYEIGLFFYPVQKWHITRDFDHRVVNAGEAVNVTINITRKAPFPIYYSIYEEVFPDSLQKVHMQHVTYSYLNTPDHVNVTRKLKRVFFPWFKRNIKQTYVLHEVPRGRHYFRNARIRITDMFGFIHKEYLFHVSEELIAYPTSRSIDLTGRLSAFDQGEQAAYSFPPKRTNIASGTREYLPGDRFSWIDWKQTARKNVLMTKEFEQEKSTDTLIVLNACNHKATNGLAFEAAVEVAFSMVEVIYKHASRADFLSIGDESIYMPLHNNEMNTMGLREHLANIEPAGNVSFAKQLGLETSKMAGGLVIILITTELDDAFKTAVLEAGSRMRRVVVIFIQGSTQIADASYEHIRELQSKGVIVNLLTEKALIQHAIEVHVA